MDLMSQLHNGEHEVHQYFLKNNNQENPRVTILFVTSADPTSLQPQ